MREGSARLLASGALVRRIPSVRPFLWMADQRRAAYWYCMYNGRGQSRRMSSGFMMGVPERVSFL